MDDERQNTKKAEAVAKRNRSRGYPAYPLEMAIDLAGRVKAALGVRRVHNREDIAKAWDMQPNSSTRRVAALVHYGLLRVVRGNIGSYELTDLSNRILSPRTSEERLDAVREAALTPVLFREVYSQHVGADLPGMLENVLEREFEILHTQAPEVADTFRETMVFAGLLQGTRLVEGRTSASTAEGEPASSTDKSPATLGEPQEDPVVASGLAMCEQNATPLKGYRDYQVVLDLERVGYVRLPEPVTLVDLESVSDWIEYTKKRLEKGSPTVSGN